MKEPEVVDRIESARAELIVFSRALRRQFEREKREEAVQ